MEDLKELLKTYQDMGLDIDFHANVEGIDLQKLLQNSTKQEAIEMLVQEKPKQVKKTLLSNDENIMKARKLADEAVNIEQLKQAIESFDGCSLKDLATNTVFSDGVVEAEVMVIGEAPGANEDIQGVPFCGDSGKLLDDALKCVGFERAKNTYITNSVFWRPPGNRKPTKEEIEMCRPFVEKHIAIINPKIIVLTGATAAQSVLNSKDSMQNIRGKFYEYKNQYMHKEIPITAIFHPSFMLRQPSSKKQVWFDLLKIKEKLIN